MSLNNNTPGVYNQYADQSLRAPNIEDPNTPDNSLQGKILTSDIGSADDYSSDYTATTISAVSDLAATGNNYNYTITISYTATLSSGSATVPGYYGSNLIKENDAFVIEARDYIRGIVNKVKNITATGGPTYTFTYELSCTVLQGDITTIAINGGQTFKWDRQLYAEGANFSDAYPPRDLISSYNKSTGEAFFYWRNINEYSRSYYLQIREIGVTPPVVYERIEIPGNSINPKTALQPFVDTGGSVSCVKIVDPGFACSSERSLTFTGSGAGAQYLTRLDSEGKLLVNEFEVYAVGAIGTDVIYVYSKNTSATYGDYPTPTLYSFIDGLPTLNGTKNFRISNISQVNPGSNRMLVLTIEEAETSNSIVIDAPFQANLLGMKVKTHDGVYRVASGTGYNNKLRAAVKTVTNCQFYYDPAVYTILNPNSEYAWSVSAFIDGINKQYTEWTEEQYIKT